MKDNGAEQLAQMANDLKQLLSNAGNITDMVGAAQDLLPKHKFTAEIDGHVFEVSLALSGKAIVLNFQDDIKCTSLYNEMKENKKGFFKRIFSK